MFLRRRGHREPGLTSAPAIGEYLAGLIAEKLGLSQKAQFDPLRKGVPHLGAHEHREAGEKIRETRPYGNIICRCEEVSGGRDLRRHPRHSGGQDPRRGQAPHQSGHGPLPGGLLLPRVMDLLSGSWGWISPRSGKTARIPRLCWKRPGAEEEAEP